MKHTNRPAGRLNRLMKWRLLCGLLGLVLVRAASGQPVALYDNENNFDPAPQDIPNIDALAFLNNNTFTIDFASSSHLQLFETEDTLNYTNNGLMIGNNGFLFDTLTLSNGLHSMASTFNNAGTIRVGSAIDGLFPVDAQPPELIVSATNIVNPGTVVVGQTVVITSESGTAITAEEANGLMQFNGQNVDLSRSSLSVEGFNLSGAFNTGVAGTGNFGTDTNMDWVPSDDLTPTIAISSESSPLAAIFPPNFDLFLTNSTPYFTQEGAGTSNVITRMVFVENYNPIPYNVYIGPVVIGTGEATIEWVGSYVDPATGNTLNNYLYLNDDYAEGSATNVGINGDGIPDNFTFAESPTQIPIGAPQVSAYPTGLIQPAGAVVTNTYSYATAQLIATSVSTNSVVTEAITNLPGRIQINATNELNLSLASISGVNYLSLYSPAQFDGSTGAQIFSPYSDINIGVTNGFLNVTNLTEANIPLWNGTVKCWSGRWLFVDATGVTNDYRVLIVGSQIVPTTSSQVQDLTLHGTNSVVISDAFHIMRTLSINAQNLTLTANTVGSGAESLDGELNFQSPSILWASAVPGLRNLTNNGAIRTQSLAAFGSAQTNYFNFINTGLIADTGAQIWANNFVSSGTFSNGVGSFALQSTNTVLTNGLLVANGDVSITTGSLLASNLVLQAGRSLTLAATNLLTDTGVTNGSIWTVGPVAVSNGKGLSLPFNPTNGDLLGTTITSIAPANVNFTVTCAGNDYGISTAGYTNNMAIGRLILDGKNLNSVFTFNGTGASNAMYVDYLEFDDFATNETSYNFPEVNISTNMVVYFAQAMLNGVSVAEKIEQASLFNGRNNGRLRWVPSYAGHFSSTNIVYPGGATNTFNAALAQSTTIDSDGDGTLNYQDPTPFFVASELNFTETLTNVPPLSIQLSWQTIPGATNYVYYTTNLSLPATNLLTSFISPSNVPPVGGWPIKTNLLDTVNPAFPKFYRVLVNPDSVDFSGP